MFILRYIVNHLKRHYKVEQGPEFVEALRHINKPSEVTVPNELIPAGVLMQLRGLFNLHCLSVNNDWIWPYWMEEQGNPKSASFIPRAMNLTWINLTHRNWTAVGVLGGRREAVVDPRGLVTPWHQGWSIDSWFRIDGKLHFPSRMAASDVTQSLRDGLPFIRTTFQLGTVTAEQEVWAFRDDDRDYVVLSVTMRRKQDSALPAQMIFSLRPYNPEGISLVHQLSYNTKGMWNVGANLAAYFPQKPSYSLSSVNETGDVSLHLEDTDRDSAVGCLAGLASGASVFSADLQKDEEAVFHAIMPLEPLNPRFFPLGRYTSQFLEAKKAEVYSDWAEKLKIGTTIVLPDERYQACFDSNRAWLLLLNDGHEITAGPLTYHRHWFRDAAYMLNALGKIGYPAEVGQNLKFFPIKQWKNGYFCSQKGEWDSNGQAIWTIVEHWRLTGDDLLLRDLYPSIRRAALWIEKKRHDVTVTNRKPRGLMPAGFSAEHLGPNDYYYWDNFWSLRGLCDAAEAAGALGYFKDQKVFEDFAANYKRDLDEAINRDLEYSPHRSLPAAPRRRPDAGMIGNIAAAYPLKLYSPPDTPWLSSTIKFIRDHLFHDDGFYQQMIHSGVNSYLTLQMAQCMLLEGDVSAFQLIDYMLELASPTWCWPEAIHPRTFGGCMGDGHHGWAAAEWLLMMRNMVVHELDGVLQITPLIPAEWCKPGKRIAIHRAPTSFGMVSVSVEFSSDSENLEIDAEWRNPPREIHWMLPTAPARIVESGEGVMLKGNMAIVPNDVRKVRLELDLKAAPSIQDASMPGLDELPHDARV
jgi:hypothetical protein